MARRAETTWKRLALADLLQEVDVRVRDLPEGESKNLEVLSLTKNWGLIPQTERFNKRVATEDISKYKVVRPGWIVYNPYVIWEGAIHGLRRIEPGVVSPVYPTFRRVEDDGGYLDFILRTDRLIEAYNQLSSGAVNRRRSIKKDDFLAIEVEIPPLVEQRAIAYVLRTVQQAKEATEKVIDAAKQMKQSLMQHLFTYGPVPFGEADKVQLKESEIGELPTTWVVRRIGELADVKGGKRLRKGSTFADSQTNYPYIRVVDFENGTVNRGEIKYLQEEDYQAISRYIIHSEDVYISIAGTIGLVGTVPPELDGANLTENAARLIVCDQRVLLRDFLFRYLASARGQNQISVRTMKTSQPKLALARIKDIPIALASLEEQRLITAYLSSIDDKIAMEEVRRISLARLFESLLHNLMTGQIRVHDLDLPERKESS